MSTRSSMSSSIMSSSKMKSRGSLLSWDLIVLLSGWTSTWEVVLTASCGDESGSCSWSSFWHLVRGRGDDVFFSIKVYVELLLLLLSSASIIVWTEATLFGDSLNQNVKCDWKRKIRLTVKFKAWHSARNALKRQTDRHEFKGLKKSRENKSASAWLSLSISFL